MKDEELKPYTIHILKMFLRTVKPWKKREEAGDQALLARGWNDCIKEMKKVGDRYIKKIQSL